MENLGQRIREISMGQQEAQSEQRRIAELKELEQYQKDWDYFEGVLNRFKKDLDRKVIDQSYLISASKSRKYKLIHDFNVHLKQFGIEMVVYVKEYDRCRADNLAKFRPI